MNQLKEKHTLLDCAYWNLFGLIPLSLALYAMAGHSTAWAAGYLVFFIGQFIVIEYRFFCTHCPHYCSGTSTTQCMFLWFVPKFFKKNPGPMKPFEMVMTVLGLSITICIPVFWLTWPLLIPYGVSWIVLGLTIRRYECCRCIHFHCPVNPAGKNDQTTLH